MRIGLSVLLASALAAWGLGCGSESAKDTVGDGSAAVDSMPVAAPAASDDRPVALFVGTSLTAGLGLDPDDAYPALVQRMADSAGIPVRLVNAGLSGETSAGALRRIDWLLAETPRLVFIETGANDGLRGLDVDSTRENLRAIVRKVKEAVPGARIFLAQMESPPNLGERYTTRFREMFPTVAREEGVDLLPFLLDGVAGIPAMNQGDGIHPNAEGAHIVAANVWRGLEGALREVGSRR